MHPLHLALAALAGMAFARKLTQKVIVEGGKDPGPMQRYLFQRTDSHLHRGIDISAPRGARVFAAQTGTVAARWPDGQVSGYGNTLVLQHPDRSQTLYAHLDTFAPGITRGVIVRKGQHIGNVGVTQKPRPPMVSKPHLHFEAHAKHDLHVREDNPPRFEPLAYLSRHNMKVGP